MKVFLNELLRGEGTRARASRSTAIVVAGFAGSNALRLISNLLLARLLVPEAFGLMSLIMVFLAGIAMFSDLGINLSIIQNEHGGERHFLDTAWTMQFLRGIFVWLALCLVAYPASIFYGENQLVYLLPVAGFTAVIQGMATTKVALANRNLQIGVQVISDLASQTFTLIVTIALAIIVGGVWALVIGSIFGAILKVSVQHFAIKGPMNRWKIDKESFFEIIKFGKYIFPSSIAGFFVNQSDRAILGKYISLADLGVFVIAFMFSNIPLDLAKAVGSKIMLPLYSKFPVRHDPGSRKKIFKARRAIISVCTVISGFLSLFSMKIIETLYDVRYSGAGVIMTVFGFTISLQIASSNYDGSYLSAGDSKSQLKLTLFQAFFQVMTSLFLISHFGVIGAIFSMALTMILVYPLRAIIVHRYGAWDPIADLCTVAFGWSVASFACWFWHIDLLNISGHVYFGQKLPT